MRAALAGVVALGAAVTGVHADDMAERSTRFVAEFERACVPGRLTYAATLEAADAADWTRIDSDADARLAALMQVSLAEAEELKADPDFSEVSFDHQGFTKSVAGVDHHLVVSRMSSVIGDPAEEPNPWVFVGCYLYDFTATAPIDPAAVTALIGNPIGRSEEKDGAIAHVWGPPCPMPRTGDTYLNFVPEGSAAAGQVPFTGVALNFSTSELSEDEPVPDPYC